jgi:hypothetical protein
MTRRTPRGPRAQVTAPAVTTTPASAPAAPASPAIPPATAPHDATTETHVSTRTVDVPALLNRLQVVAVAACLLFAVATATLQLLAWHANRAAADDTEQLVRVQNIQSTLFRADALATNAFLVGGLEPPAQRKAYDTAIDQVSASIADAAEAQPADRNALAALNTSVNHYAATVEQARANNRQGFPVGAEYLRTASNQLRTEAVPIVAELVDANSQRAEDEMHGQHPPWFLLVGAVALLALYLVNRQLASRFRRRFNLGLVGAAAVVLILTLVAVFVSTGQRSDNESLLSGSYRTAVDEATARTAGNDAKSNESLRLIARGSGQAFEDAWKAASTTVEAKTTAGDDWAAYVAVHERIVKLDNDGRWDAAVALATTSAPGGSTAALETFDRHAQAVVTDNGSSTVDTLRSGNGGVLALAIVTLLLGLVAAGAATWGIGQRRREYA